jgi:hypothetical protein
MLRGTFDARVSGMPQLDFEKGSCRSLIELERPNTRPNERPPARGALAATCTSSQVVPNIAELMVSQGAPGHTRYARGKEGLVRAYLTNPTVCTLSNKQSITPVSATLQVE